MRISIVRKKKARGGSDYQVSFPQGDAFLTDSLDGRVVEVIWFGIDDDFQGQGVAEQVMSKLHTHFREKPIVPVNIVPGAEGFWQKMAQRGYCRFDGVATNQ